MQKLTIRGKLFSYQSVRWCEETFGSAFFALIWTLSNPFGDEPSLD